MMITGELLGAVGKRAQQIETPDLRHLQVRDNTIGRGFRQRGEKFLARSEHIGDKIGRREQSAECVADRTVIIDDGNTHVSPVNMMDVNVGLGTILGNWT